MLKTYVQLSKPGIIMGNVITATSGFILASKGQIDFALLALTLFGLSCVIASACVFNNFFDRFSDEKMQRTKTRPLVTKEISHMNAIIFGVLVGITGFTILYSYTNSLTTYIASIGFFVYVFVYSFLKHHTVYATLIGSIAGAVPPVVGYTAVTHRLDLCGILLFTIVSLWQMPHFFAIALYRLDDYTKASIPVLPVVKGIQTTKIQMLLYVIAFVISTWTLFFFGFTGYAYLIVASFLGLFWLKLSFQGFSCKDNTLWARKMFLFSLIMITALSIMISVDGNGIILQG